MLYSTTARSNVPIRLLAILDTTQTTAGTWAVAPTNVSLSLASPYKVGARAQGATTTIATTATTIVFGTRNYDTHNAYNPSTGEFTVPLRAVYFISALIGTTTGRTGTIGSLGDLGVYINGSLSARIGMYRRQATTSSVIPYLSGASSVFLAAGDVVTLRAARPASDDGDWICDTSYTFMSIDQIN